MGKALVWLLLTKKLKQRNATVHAEWRQPGGPVGMRWVRGRAAASPALRSHERVITSLTDTLSHFAASASVCLCLPPFLRLLKRISSHPWHTPVLAMPVCLCLSPRFRVGTHQAWNAICLMTMKTSFHFIGCWKKGNVQDKSGGLWLRVVWNRIFFWIPLDSFVLIMYKQ